MCIPFLYILKKSNKKHTHQYIVHYILFKINWLIFLFFFLLSLRTLPALLLSPLQQNDSIAVTRGAISATANNQARISKLDLFCCCSFHHINIKTHIWCDMLIAHPHTHTLLSPRLGWRFAINICLVVFLIWTCSHGFAQNYYCYLLYTMCLWMN